MRSYAGGRPGLVERACDALIRTKASERSNPAAQLLRLKGMGPEFASLLKPKRVRNQVFSKTLAAVRPERNAL